MHKNGFIDYIVNQQNCTKIEAEKIINIFSNAVISVLAEGKDITLIGFGKFYSTKVVARTGKNPRTGQPLQIEAYVQPKFSAGEKLKSACNGRDSKSKTIKK